MKKQVKKTVKTASNKQTADAAVAASTSLVPFQAMLLNLDLEKIVPSKLNPRREIAEAPLAELTDSILRYGVQTPIKVRPIDNDRYEIVYGERRYRASLAAGKPCIPAYIQSMTDEEAEICAVTENMQRADFSPFEEAAIFRRYAEEKDWSIARIAETFSKSETYIRKRLNLTCLIEPFADLLRRNDISLEVAFELAKYDEQVQTEVYTEHFAGKEWGSWIGIKAKDLAKRLYERYACKLERYSFDKSDCETCQYNTLNQTLFRDCAEDCGACQNKECLEAKNAAYVLDRCIESAQADPYLQLAINSESNPKVVEALSVKGYELTELDIPEWKMEQEPQMPERPVLDREDYEDDDDFVNEQEWYNQNYEQELQEYNETVEYLKCRVAEGRIWKYAVIGYSSIKIFYRIIADKPAENNDTATEVGAELQAPTAKLEAKDNRNREICYEHTTSDLKQLLRCKKENFPQTPLTDRERLFFTYALLADISGTSESPLELGRYPSQQQRLEYAESITPEQQTALTRMVIMSYFEKIRENGVTDETPDVQLLSEFTDLHWPEQSKAIQEKHRSIYDKRHASLQQRIEAIQKEAELLQLRKQAAARALPTTTVSQDGITVDPTTGEIIDGVEEVQAVEVIDTVAEADRTLKALPAATTESDTTEESAQQTTETERSEEQPADYPQTPEPEIEEPAEEQSPQWMEDEPESEQGPETGEPASAPYALPDLLSKSDDTKQAA